MRVAVVMPLAEQRGGAEQMLMHLLQANRRGLNLAYHVLFFEHGLHEAHLTKDSSSNIAGQ